MKIFQLKGLTVSFGILETILPCKYLYYKFPSTGGAKSIIIHKPFFILVHIVMMI